MKWPAIVQIIPAAWLRLFSPAEFNQLLGGGESGGVDVADLEAHTTYGNGYTRSSPTIKSFWKVCLLSDPVATAGNDVPALLHLRPAAIAAFCHMQWRETESSLPTAD